MYDTLEKGLKYQSFLSCCFSQDKRTKKVWFTISFPKLASSVHLSVYAAGLSPPPLPLPTVVFTPHAVDV